MWLWLYIDISTWVLLTLNHSSLDRNAEWQSSTIMLEYIFFDIINISNGISYGSTYSSEMYCWYRDRCQAHVVGNSSTIDLLTELKNIYSVLNHFSNEQSQMNADCACGLVCYRPIGLIMGDDGLNSDQWQKQMKVGNNRLYLLI